MATTPCNNCGAAIPLDDWFQHVCPLRNEPKISELHPDAARYAEVAKVKAAPKKPYHPYLSPDDYTSNNPIRGKILDKAKAHTLGDRNEVHGDPIPAMELFMDLAQPVIDADLPKAVKGALILEAYKTARILYNPYHVDSYEDKCAYGAIAGEAAVRSRNSS